MYIICDQPVTGIVIRFQELKAQPQSRIAPLESNLRRLRRFGDGSQARSVAEIAPSVDFLRALRFRLIVSGIRRPEIMPQEMQLIISRRERVSGMDFAGIKIRLPPFDDSVAGKDRGIATQLRLSHHAASQTAIRIRRISAFSFFPILREYRSGIACRKSS